MSKFDPPVGEYRYKMFFLETTWTISLTIAEVEMKIMTERDLVMKNAREVRREHGWTCCRVDRWAPGQQLQRDFHWPYKKGVWP